MNDQNILTQGEVFNLVQPYAEKIHSKIYAGFNDYLENDGDRAYIHNNTVKSNLVRSYIIRRIKELVLEQPTWRWLEKRRMVCIVIEDKIWLRFKKLDKKYLTQNVRTKQVDAFRGQQKVETFPYSTGKFINIDIGWLLDDFYKQIEGIYIVCPNKRKNLWRIKFQMDEVKMGKEVPMFTDEESKNVIQIAKVKEHLKKTKKDNNKSNEAS